MRIAFLGGGQMARALALGLLRAKKSTKDAVVAADVSPEGRAGWSKATGCPVYAANTDALAGADVAVLAVKPQHLDGLMAEIRPHLAPRNLVISIAAGVPLQRLIDGLGEDRRLVRVMPNTPCLVGAGASGVAIGGAATDADAETALDLFRSVGVAYRVPEPLLDAVTGLSGSGPAYGFLAIEALADGGVAAGLPRDVALALAAQTLLGAARMVLETGQHPGALKDQVASPAGTTIAGLAVLERHGVRGAFLAAVQAAADRARELGQR